MKRWISLLMVMTLLLGLCACSSKEPNASPDNSSLKNAIDPAASASSEADAYVTVEETKTKLGLIQIPQINEVMLKSEDVRLANAMFRSIRDRELELLEEWKTSLGDETDYDAAEPLCVARYTKNDDSLSIMVKYVRRYPNSVSENYCEAVNFDFSTGKALDHNEVIKAAGYTQDEVKTALRSYAEKCMFFEWEEDVYYTSAVEGTIPEGMGDPSLGWQEELDNIVESYDDPMPSQGEPWDALPRHPAVYAGEAGLEVCVSIPAMTGDAVNETMVCIGHNDEETKRLNPNDQFGEPFGRGAMLTDAACEAVAQSVDVKEAASNGIQYSVSAESMEVIQSEDQADPAYVCRVSTDMGDFLATAAWYAVGVFSGAMWEMDMEDGEWVSIMNGTGLLPEAIFTGAETNGALAVIWNEPGKYGLWAANPCDEVDLIAYGSNLDHYTSNSETCLLFAREDNTLVSFENGTIEGDTFVSKSKLYSLTLNSGESVLFYVLRPEGMPSQAITVSTKSGEGTYVMEYNGIDGTSEFEYITPSSAAE